MLTDTEDQTSMNTESSNVETLCKLHSVIPTDHLKTVRVHNKKHIKGINNIAFFLLHLQ